MESARRLDTILSKKSLGRDKLVKIMSQVRVSLVTS